MSFVFELTAANALKFFSRLMCSSAACLLEVLASKIKERAAKWCIRELCWVTIKPKRLWEHYCEKDRVHFATFKEIQVPTKSSVTYHWWHKTKGSDTPTAYVTPTRIDFKCMPTHRGSRCLRELHHCPTSQCWCTLKLLKSSMTPQISLWYPYHRWGGKVKFVLMLAPEEKSYC